MNTQQYNISDNNFEQCIKCTICTVYCPVVPVNPDYPGPKQAGPDGERFRLKTPYFYDKALKYCLNCKRCEVACPSGVRIGDMIQKARLRYNRRPPKLRDIILANTDVVGTVATKMAPLVNATVKSRSIKYALDKVMAIDQRRSFPAYSSGTFENWYRREAASKQNEFSRHVSYFHGCYVNYNFPQLGKDLVKIMNAIGYGVHLLDGEKCCGVALISNGLTLQASAQAKRNMKSIRKSVLEKDMPVIATSSTCCFTLRDEYPNILNIDNADVRSKIDMATRFIYRLIDQGKVKLAFKQDFHLHLGYHTPCHMERMGWSVYSILLLRMIPGLDLEVLPSECCGIAGTYGFKKENYETSQKIGEKLFNHIREAGVYHIATDCETCKWQIEMSIHLTVMNPISILADALDVEATRALNNF